MKVKVINSNLEDFNNTFKVRRMNFDQIIVNYPTGDGIKVFLFSDVECISENKIDDFLIENREFLKIKLKRGIGVAFYNALKESIEEEIDEKVTHIKVIKDKYNINKRGIWEKELIIFANKKHPLDIICSGEKFKKDSYNIITNKIFKDNFLEICNVELEHLRKEIEQKNGIISSLEEIIGELKMNCNDIQFEDEK